MVRQSSMGISLESCKVRPEEVHLEGGGISFRGRRSRTPGGWEGSGRWSPRGVGRFGAGTPPGGWDSVGGLGALVPPGVRLWQPPKLAPPPAR